MAGDGYLGALEGAVIDVALRAGEDGFELLAIDAQVLGPGGGEVCSPHLVSSELPCGATIPVSRAVVGGMRGEAGGPARFARYNGRSAPVAQGTEQAPSKRLAAGSNPAGGASFAVAATSLPGEGAD